MRSLPISLAALLLLGTPAVTTAQSYLSPEQVLQQSEDLFLVPGRKRGAQWWADLQAQQAVERHPSIIQEPWDMSNDAGIPPLMPQVEPEPTIVEDYPVVPATSPHTNLDPLTARLLERLIDANIMRSNVQQSTAADAGAPLADTGPASILAVLAMGGASLWTLRRARVLEKFVQGL